MYSGCCQSNRWSSGLFPSIATFPLFFPFSTTSLASHMSKTKKKRKEKKHNKTQRGSCFQDSLAHPRFSSPRGVAILWPQAIPCISSGKTQACETGVGSLNSTTSRHPCLRLEPEPCCFSPKTMHLTRHSTLTSTFFKAQRVQLI